MNFHGQGIDFILDTPGCPSNCHHGHYVGYFTDTDGAFRVPAGIPKDGYLRIIDNVDDKTIARLRSRETFAKTGNSFSDAAKYYCRLAAPQDWCAAQMVELGEAFNACKPDSAKPDAKGVPAAYTYLGQFLAHELSNLGAFDRGRLSTKVISSYFDLDSLFDAPNAGRREGQSWLDSVGVGAAAPFDEAQPPCQHSWTDVPRTDTGTPIIADERNSDNLPLSQIHVAFSKFHQVVCSTFPKLGSEVWREITTRHIQALYLNDYLPMVCDPDTYQDVMCNGRRLVYPDGKQDNFLLPIEFSGAAFRVGHSMIRGEYKKWTPNGSAAPLRDLLVKVMPNILHSVDGRMEAEWAMPWVSMAWTDATRADALIAASAFDVHLSDYLYNIRHTHILPDFAMHHTEGEIKNLASLSLLRGEFYRLSSAQDLIAQINKTLSASSAPSSLQTLTTTEMQSVAGPHLFQTIEKYGFDHQTPLYLYCLFENQHRNLEKMGPLTSRIVVETVHAAIQHSNVSIIHKDGVQVEFNGSCELKTDKEFGLQQLLGINERNWKPQPLT